MKKTRVDRRAFVRTVCSFCACELEEGEEAWYINGAYICEDCFPAFSRLEFSAYRVIIGGDA
ncbi:MAG: hypothetical protein IJA73_00270 [Oscillospiraceae bacterium]|nr:hypothetical protein [Oscillospiraceae bacterium]